MARRGEQSCHISLVESIESSEICESGEVNKSQESEDAHLNPGRNCVPESPKTGKETVRKKFKRVCRRDEYAKRRRREEYAKRKQRQECTLSRSESKSESGYPKDIICLESGLSREELGKMLCLVDEKKQSEIIFPDID